MEQHVSIQKLICRDSGVLFDGAASWSFGNEFAQNVIVFDQ